MQVICRISACITLMGLEPMLLLNTSGKYLSKVESNTLLVGYASIPLST
jgi:hypothetical protein